MNITDRHIVDRLEENGLRYAVLPLQNGVTIIISERGGRVFGPFLEPAGESIYWVSGAFTQTETFRKFLDAGDWNLGGDRNWIAPEVQYIVKDRANPAGSESVPAQMDPGQHRLDQPRSGQWRLRQDMTLTAYNTATGLKELHLETLTRPIEDPLRYVGNYHNLAAGVVYAGYEQVISLSESKLDAIMSEAWNVIALNPGGVMLVPVSPSFEVTDYVPQPIDANFQAIHSNYVSLRVTGDRQYKVGYKAAHTTGRLAYLNYLDDGRAYLVIRNFFNNPSSIYIEEPAPHPGRWGDSIHVYNDGGQYGGYGELESHGQTIGGMTGKSSSTDQFALWLYVGAPGKIEEIAAHLLGIDLAGQG